MFHASTSRTAFGNRSVLLSATPYRQNLRGSDARLLSSGSWWLRLVVDTEEDLVMILRVFFVRGTV